MSTLRRGEGSRGRLPADPLLAAKIRPPLARPEWVARTRLIDDLERATLRPVTLIAAPAGYGKTTLAAQWLAADGHRGAVAWISLDTADDDPVPLWTHIATSLQRAGCVIARDIAGFVAGAGSDVATVVVQRILHAIGALASDIIVLIDDFEVVRSAQCAAQVDFFIEHLPSNAHLVLITRVDPTLKLGRLRAAGQLTEIRADDLAFNIEEASALLHADRVELSSAAASELMHRTEGWPAGLYLAKLYLAGRPDPGQFVYHFTGNNRFIGDYLTEEVLSRQTDEVRSFILDMSVVDRFTAQLADYMTGAHRSASILRELEHSNLFLIPLDDDGRWFRFHHLFRAVTKGALEAKDPDRAILLHRRAAEWMSQNGDINAAVSHAMAAGATDLAASLVQGNWLRYFDGGRAATVRRWLRALGSSAASASAAYVVTAAWMAALSGERGELASRLAQLGGVSDHVALPDRTASAESAMALIRGLLGYEGPIEMLAAARRAVELETDGSTPWYAVAHAALGHASYVVGDRDTALTTLPKAAYSEATPALVRIGALATLALTESELRHDESCRRLAEEAMEVVDSRSLHALPHVSLAFTAIGQSQAAFGDLQEAMLTLEHGLSLRRRLPGLSPWPTIHHLIIMGRLAGRVGDRALGRRLLDEAAQLIQQYQGGTAAMLARLEAAQRNARDGDTNGQGIESLTAREIDILRRLTGSLSLGEIASELYISPNTVKTHTTALYRKLGARSRSEAITIARKRLLI